MQLRRAMTARPPSSAMPVVKPALMLGIGIALVMMLGLLTTPALGANPCKENNFTCPSDGCPVNCASDMFVCDADLNKVTNKTTYECMHSSMFEGNVGRDVGTLLVLFVFLGMSSAGGIGGGGLIIPILSVVTLFPTYYAVPLSSTAIVGASIVQFGFQIRRRHPVPGAQHRRVIDFDTILMLLPLALAGTVIGVNFNTVSPNWLVLAVVVVVLTFTTYKTLKKGIQLRRQEKRKKQAPRQSIVKTRADDPNSVNSDSSGGGADKNGGEVIVTGDDTPHAKASGNGRSRGHSPGADTGNTTTTTTGGGSGSGSSRGSSSRSRHNSSSGSGSGRRAHGRSLSSSGGAGSGRGGRGSAVRKSHHKSNSEHVLIVDYSMATNATHQNHHHHGEDGDHSSSDESMEGIEMPNLRSSKDTPEIRRQREKLMAEEAAVPWRPILITLFELGGVVVFSLIRGGSGTSLAGVTCGEGSYWGVQVSTFVFLCLCTFGGYLYVRRHHRRRLEVNYKFVEGDIDYVGGNVFKYLFFAMVAGILAGFLGIGGGMVLAPLLLQFNMHPLVSSATTAYMTLFTSTGSFTQFVILNRVPYDYGIALFLLACMASVAGQIILYAYVGRTGNTSIIAFILGTVIGLANIMLLVSGSIQIKDDYDAGKSFGFRPLCG